MKITKFYELNIGDKFYVNGQEYIKTDGQTAQGKTNSQPSHFDGNEILEMPIHSYEMLAGDPYPDEMK